MNRRKISALLLSCVLAANISSFSEIVLADENKGEEVQNENHKESNCIAGDYHEVNNGNAKNTENTPVINGIKVNKQLIDINYSQGVTINPKYIVIHDTDNRQAGANAMANRNYFANHPNAKASAHYIIDEGNIIQALEDTWKGWHVGDGNNPNINNSTTIAIELCVNKGNDFDKTLENGIPLLTEEYGINKTQNTPFSVYKIPLLNSKNVVTVSRPLDINSTTNIDFKKITYKKTNIDNQNNYSDFIIEILNNLCTILAASNVNIFLFNSDNSVINSYASSTINENIFYENITIKIDEPLLSKIDNKTNSFKRYKYINSILSKYYKKEYTTKNTSSFIVKALCFANKVIGILHINYDNITKYQINNEGLIKDICDNLSSLLVSFNVTNEFEKYVFKKNMINSVEYSPSILLSKMNYFATLSHEFKTPINIILSSIQLLLKLLSDNCEIDNDTLLKYLNILKQNSYRLLRLVNNVLDSSKLENNFTDLTLVNCNIINIIENIVLSTCDYLEQNNKEIIFDTDEEEVFLSCDPDKIEKVVLV